MFYIFLGIIVLFFMILVIKSFVRKEFCAICSSVSLTWMFLLVVYWFGKFDDSVLIALLVGQSVLGVFYLAEKKSSDALKIFRLPFLLSLVFVAYSLIVLFIDLAVLELLVVLWIIFGAIFLYRDNSRMKLFVDKIVACCKWG